MLFDKRELKRTSESLDIKLHVCDCVEGMKQHLDAESVDVVVTSPPYNIGTKYKRYDDTSARADYLAWCDVWIRELARVLSPKGSFFLNVGGTPKDPHVPFQLLDVACRHFRLQNVIHWIKSIAIDRESMGNYPGRVGDLSVGHYKPIRGKRFVNDCHEYIFHLTQDCDVELERTAIGVPYQDKSNVKRWKSAGKDKRCRGNVWFIPYKTIQSRKLERPHPATFPPKLPEMCIRLHGLKKTRLVLDPFTGLGNTALACARLGIAFVGFEIDSEYAAVASERLAEEAGVDVLEKPSCEP